jgi:hypothetical protein
MVTCDGGCREAMRDVTVAAVLKRASVLGSKLLNSYRIEPGVGCTQHLHNVHILSLPGSASSGLKCSVSHMFMLAYTCSVTSESRVWCAVEQK